MTKLENQTTSIAKLPKLGVGVGFRPVFKGDLFLNQQSVDFIEVIADHYLDAPNAKLEELHLLNQHFQLVFHGLNLSLGSAEGINEIYLEKLAKLLQTVRPAWFSEHICFTKAGGIEIGHLAPIPFTFEALKVLVKNISKVKKQINTPLILENITYMFRFPFSEMEEAEFLTRIVNETDCGLLLDVTNLYINSVNHQFDWRKLLDKLPLERVVQLHFVGGHRHQNLLIDSHSQKTQDEIWQVFAEVCQRCDVKAAILERDENFPPFAEILTELETARKLMN